MATEKQITERWGATHEIQKQKLVGEIDLRYLNKNESVAMGDGKTFYWLLTEKDVVKYIIQMQKESEEIKRHNECQ